MKLIFSELRRAVILTFMLAVVCCGIYPLVVYGIGESLFRNKAEGSLILDSNHDVIGSRLIGQSFSSVKYFHSRPSAAGNGYDATSSGGSNLGPTSKKLADSTAQNVIDYRSQNGLGTNDPVPADAVTASASGLDPHISPESARLQIARVSASRGIKEDAVKRLVEQFVEPPQWGFLGQARVNVLLLNVALDKLSADIKKAQFPTAAPSRG